MKELDMILKAQAEIEILNGKSPSKSLLKLEEKLRKNVLKLRSICTRFDAHEIGDLITITAKYFNFEKIQVIYQSLYPAPDGATMLQYEATLDGFHCFIYVRDL